VYLKELELIAELNSNWASVLPSLFLNPYGCNDFPVSEQISTSARLFYFLNRTVSNETLFEFTKLLSDRDLIHGGYTVGKWMTTNVSEVYLYSMTKRPQKSYSDVPLTGYPDGFDYGIKHAICEKSVMYFCMNFVQVQAMRTNFSFNLIIMVIPNI
jgi:hypothetical protein